MERSALGFFSIKQQKLVLRGNTASLVAAQPKKNTTECHQNNVPADFLF